MQNTLIPSSLTSQISFRERFFAPIVEALERLDVGRECMAISDANWFMIGCLRVVSQETSGRGLLQRLCDLSIIEVNRQTFQESLKSPRRLRTAQAVNRDLLEQLEKTVPDPFSEIPSLRNFDLYAADGHFHAHACHDQAIGGKKRPVEHFYSLNLRTNGLSHLTQAQIGGTRKKEHDMHALKRLDIDTLRQNAAVGRKVLYVYDRACIDFPQWSKWKESGLYFITKLRSDLKLTPIKGNPGFDPYDPINAGVISDEIVEDGSSSTIRRITYRCPESGDLLVFLTNVFSGIPAGVIAYLYKRRWGIEKIFDVVKNKYHEKKSWATSPIAKDNQAHFIALHHNLLCLFEMQVNMADVEKEHKKRSVKRIVKLGDKLKKLNRTLSPLLTSITYITQHSLKFIRWLRVSLESNTPVTQAMGRLGLDLAATF